LATSDALVLWLLSLLWTTIVKFVAPFTISSALLGDASITLSTADESITLSTADESGGLVSVLPLLQAHSCKSNSIKTKTTADERNNILFKKFPPVINIRCAIYKNYITIANQQQDRTLQCCGQKVLFYLELLLFLDLYSLGVVPFNFIKVRLKFLIEPNPHSIDMLVTDISVVSISSHA
jgi:hypothetical protein